MGCLSSKPTNHQQTYHNMTKNQRYDIYKRSKLREKSNSRQNYKGVNMENRGNRMMEKRKRRRRKAGGFGRVGSCVGSSGGGGGGGSGGGCGD